MHDPDPPCPDATLNKGENSQIRLLTLAIQLFMTFTDNRQECIRRW